MLNFNTIFISSSRYAASDMGMIWLFTWFLSSQFTSQFSEVIRSFNQCTNKEHSFTFIFKITSARLDSLVFSDKDNKP